MRPLAVVTLAFGAGCFGTGAPPGSATRAAWEESELASRKRLLSRAAFDLNCPAGELEFKALVSEAYTSNVYTKQAGVSGCGKRATYVNTSNGWIVNSPEGNSLTR